MIICSVLCRCIHFHPKPCMRMSVLSRFSDIEEEHDDGSFSEEKEDHIENLEKLEEQGKSHTEFHSVVVIIFAPMDAHLKFDGCFYIGHTLIE